MKLKWYLGFMTVASSANAFLNTLQRWGLQSSSLCELPYGLPSLSGLLLFIYLHVCTVFFPLWPKYTSFAGDTPASVDLAVFFTRPSSPDPYGKSIQSVTTLTRKLKTHCWAILTSLKFEQTFLPAGFADQNFSLSLQKTAESYNERVLAPQKNLDCQSCPVKETP